MCWIGLFSKGKKRFDECEEAICERLRTGGELYELQNITSRVSRVVCEGLEHYRSRCMQWSNMRFSPNRHARQEKADASRKRTLAALRKVSKLLCFEILRVFIVVVPVNLVGHWREQIMKSAFETNCIGWRTCSRHILEHWIWRFLKKWIVSRSLLDYDRNACERDVIEGRSMQHSESAVVFTGHTSDQIRRI